MSDEAHQITRDVSEVNSLALALERAEFGGIVPELQVPNGYVYYDDNGAAQIHPLASAYYAAIFAWADRPAKASKTLADSQRSYLIAKTELERKERARAQGGGGGLRRLIDSMIWADLALRDLRAVEARMERAEKGLGVRIFESRRKPRVERD
jgi:hypothetical protein